MNKNKSRSSGVSSEQEMRTEFELFALWKLRLHVLGTNNHVYIGQKHKKKVKPLSYLSLLWMEGKFKDLRMYLL